MVQDEKGTSDPNRFVSHTTVFLAPPNNQDQLVGWVATSYCLYQAVLAVKAGDSTNANRMFRYRIYCQGLTLIALLGGAFYYNSDKILFKEYEKLKVAKKKKEQNEAWIKELEARDQEDQEAKAKMERLKNLQREAAQQVTADGKSKGGGVVDAIRRLEESRKESLEAAKAAVERSKKS